MEGSTACQEAIAKAMGKATAFRQRAITIVLTFRDVRSQQATLHIGTKAHYL